MIYAIFLTLCSYFTQIEITNKNQQNTESKNVEIKADHQLSMVAISRYSCRKFKQERGGL